MSNTLREMFMKVYDVAHLKEKASGVFHFYPNQVRPYNRYNLGSTAFPFNQLSCRDLGEFVEFCGTLPKYISFWDGVIPEDQLPLIKDGYYSKHEVKHWLTRRVIRVEYRAADFDMVMLKERESCSITVPKSLLVIHGDL